MMTDIIVYGILILILICAIYFWGDDDNNPNIHI